MKSIYPSAVFHAESNCGIFMFVSRLQRQKMHIKISTCTFVVIYHLGIENRRIDFIFVMYIVETSLHNIFSCFKTLKNVDLTYFLY